MTKLLKLTMDEAGKLHGGFAIQSVNENGKTYLNNNNGNCGIGGNGDTNANCSCAACAEKKEPVPYVPPFIPPTPPVPKN